ncbi:hypothetical protein [Sphingomonas oleivorans]|uniref:hypothetical protein n=1 Tax=Sphingomonas oleivorans TaxID=1735121 RepID=UPI0013FDE6F1|nr:hypothetical protein [Sphingomonas oleivorans]
MASLLGPVAMAVFGLLLIGFGIVSVRKDDWGSALVAFVLAMAAFGSSAQV